MEYKNKDSEKEYGFGRSSYEFGEESRKEMKSKYDLGFKNKSIDVMGYMYGEESNEKPPKKEKKLNLGEDSMFTGNTYFDIGLAIGRRLKEKKQNK
jgi:hypothetical protein